MQEEVYSLEQQKEEAGKYKKNVKANFIITEEEQRKITGPPTDLEGNVASNVAVSFDCTSCKLLVFDPHMCKCE